MAALVRRFGADESGATAIEYGLIAALMGIALIAAFVTFGNSLMALFGYVKTEAGNVLDAAGS